MENKPEVIILHCSGGITNDPTYDTSQQSLQVIDNWHKGVPNYFPKSELGWHIGYHYVCEYNTGKITQTRKETEIGCHCLKMNDKSLGILIVGNFDRLPVLPHSKPSEVQEKSITILLRQLRQRYPNIPIRGHRFYATYKTCPGRNMPDDYGEKLIKEPENTTPEPIIATLEQQKLTLMEQIITTLKLLIIRLQNRLGKNKYA
jgi:N-acetyl-anhydromuramyl-L-alanine amidase AmpD